MRSSAHQSSGHGRLHANHARICTEQRDRSTRLPPVDRDKGAILDVRQAADVREVLHILKGRGRGLRYTLGRAHAELGEWGRCAERHTEALELAPQLLTRIHQRLVARVVRVLRAHRPAHLHARTVALDLDERAFEEAQADASRNY